MGPTLVAVATTFGLGAEIQSPTGLSVLSGCLSVCVYMSAKHPKRICADLDDIFRKECLLAREKSIDFWGGSGFFRGLKHLVKS